MSTEIAFIGRASCYSPQSVEKDHAILAAVRSRLQEQFRCQEIVQEDALTSLPPAGAYVSMGRNPKTLEWLTAAEHQGRLTVNAPAAVSLCNHRLQQMQQLAAGGITVPPLQGEHGYWVKRGMGCRMTDDDVQYAKSLDEAERLKAQMHRRGVDEVEIRAHVPGTWVKFYGVGGTGFFRSYQMESAPRQTELPALQQLAENAAETVRLDVYGGDAILGNDGQPVLVDLNDWPSFSPCREEAAECIARLIGQRINGI